MITLGADEAKTAVVERRGVEVLERIGIAQHRGAGAKVAGSEATSIGHGGRELRSAHQCAALSSRSAARARAKTDLVREAYPAPGPGLKFLG